ncbi:hypothetical protein Bca4012_066372 [Brassica carinata]
MENSPDSDANPEVGHGGLLVAFLEITGNGILVQVNHGKCYQKSACVHLHGGGEIFQPLKDENLAAPDRASSVNVCEARGAPLKGFQVETRAGDSSAVDRASILASLSRYRNLRLLPPIAKSAKRLQNLEVPVRSHTSIGLTILETDSIVFIACWWNHWSYVLDRPLITRSRLLGDGLPKIQRSLKLRRQKARRSTPVQAEEDSVETETCNLSDSSIQNKTERLSLQLNQEEAKVKPGGTIAPQNWPRDTRIPLRSL